MSDLRISRDEMAEALDQAWSSFVADTGCFPDCLTLWKSKGVIAADFHRGNFAQMVADWLNRTIPSVPEGHELVVLPYETVDEVRGWKAGAGLKVPAVDWQTIWHLASGCKAAVARRPKPKTELVPWWEAVGRHVLDQDGQRVSIESVMCGDGAGPSVFAYNAAKRRENTLLRVSCCVRGDGMVEVLIEDRS